VLQVLFYIIIIRKRVALNPNPKKGWDSFLCFPR
jgi:hypothetical protein